MNAIATTQYAPALNVDVSAMQRTPRGAYVRDLVVGTGTTAQAGTTVGVRYQGHLTNGTPFDGNPAPAPLLTFQVGAGRMIPGFEEGVTGMKVGGRRQVIIPPELAYGSQPNGPIPANSILVFTLELVEAR